MRRNKIRTGWNAIPREKKKFVKAKLSWSLRYEYKHLKEDNIISKIIKFIISISLFFSFDRKNVSKAKRTATVDNTYSILSSSSFRFIPSSVAFYLFLSIIPIAVIVVSIMGALNTTWSQFLINETLPRLIPGTQNLFTTSVDFKSANFLFLILFLASSTWFASKGINKLRESFTELYGYTDNQNFIIKRIKSLFVVILISLYFTLLAICFVPMMNLIHKQLDNKIGYEALFYILSFFYLLVFGYLGIGLLFKYISPIRLKWSYLNLGILTSLIPTILFLLLFSTICKFFNYEKFGAIGSFLYLIMFILYISYFLHAGIIINSSYYKTNIFQNIVVRKSFISKRIVIICRNVWYKFKFNRINK